MRYSKPLTIEGVDYKVRDVWFASGTYSTTDVKNKCFALIQHPERHWESKTVQITEDQAKEL